LPESAKIGLDDVNRGVGTTLGVLKEAMSILHG